MEEYIFSTGGLFLFRYFFRICGGRIPIQGYESRDKNSDCGQTDDDFHFFLLSSALIFPEFRAPSLRMRNFEKIYSPGEKKALLSQRAELIGIVSGDAALGFGSERPLCDSALRKIDRKDRSIAAGFVNGDPISAVSVTPEADFSVLLERFQMK